ncbi:helix-hairpin-helix domain-containing protein [Candidatus Spongiihabitans sp.]|uniref:helix-hairpin-helix domain-containing protein n=1 Tax=Candidatus Spongiihabitans sp. TaxID=3101308 RepID=UPI003C704CF5
MKKYLRHVLRHVLRFALLGCIALPMHAAELVSITGVTLIDAELNDGDSFKVNASGRELHLRLYYVDCPETAYGSKADFERIGEQQDHFGLNDRHAVIRFGRRAAEYTKQALSRPFTIHTSYAKALGRSAAGRFYAFVETNDGHDLSRLLIKQGLARIHGKTRPAPSGLPSDLVLEELQDLEVAAMLKRVGIWAEADPNIIAEKRKRRREEKQAERKAQKEFRDKQKTIDEPSTTNPMDLNTAASKQLQQINHIGPVIAAKIIAGRPYQSLQDLLKIPGIGAKTLEVIAPYVTID